MTKNTIAFDLSTIAKTIAAPDRKALDAMATEYVAGMSAAAAIDKAMAAIVKRHGYDALSKGSPNPKVTIDTDPAVTAERKSKKANPFLRYLWLAVQAAGQSDKTASNLVSRVKACAAKHVPFSVDPKGAKGQKVKTKGEPSMRIMLINSPDELTAAMGLQEWLSKSTDKYPELAAFLTPALRAYLGDAADDVYLGEGDTE